MIRQEPKVPANRKPLSSWSWQQGCFASSFRFLRNANQLFLDTWMELEKWKIIKADFRASAGSKMLMKLILISRDFLEFLFLSTNPKNTFAARQLRLWEPGHLHLIVLRRFFPTCHFSLLLSLPPSPLLSPAPTLTISRAIWRNGKWRNQNNNFAPKKIRSSCKKNYFRKN